MKQSVGSQVMRMKAQGDGGEEYEECWMDCIEQTPVDKNNIRDYLSWNTNLFQGVPPAPRSFLVVYWRSTGRLVEQVVYRGRSGA